MVIHKPSFGSNSSACLKLSTAASIWLSAMRTCKCGYDVKPDVSEGGFELIMKTQKYLIMKTLKISPTNAKTTRT